MTTAPQGTPGKKVRVGIMLDSLTAPAWIYVMLERIVASSYAEIVVIVRDGSPAQPRQSAWRRLMRYRRNFLYVLYRKLDRFLFRPKPDAFAPRDLSPLLAGIPILDIVPQRKKFSDRFSPEDLANIKKYDLDVLVRLGFRILRGEILSAARCGVWSFHHGDPNEFRGGPAGAWEVFLGSPTTGSILQMLNEELDGGIVLYRSQACTDTVSVTRNLNGYYWKTLSFLPRSLEELHRLGPECFLAKARAAHPSVNLYSYRLYTAPRNLEMVGILARLAWHMTTRRVKNIFYDNQWRLLAQKSNSLNGSLDQFQQIIPPKEVFWADPNIFEHEGRSYVFIEQCSMKTDKGDLAVFAIGADGKWPQKPDLVLQRPYHLSYPFVFHYRGEIHMLVECSTVRRVESYRCIEFPHRWEGPTIVMDNVSAVDATLHEQDGRWWMFANMVENEGASAWDELYLFHAPDPFSNQWTPHPRNPIVSDVRSSRPAGALFYQDGKLIRPSQNCAGGYGRGVVFNHVLKLTETEYEERPIGQIQPNWGKTLRVTHSFTRGGGWIVCDAGHWVRRF